MTGTAILFQEDKKVTIIENIEQTTFEEIKQQCGCHDCACKINNKVVHFGPVQPAFWDDDIDWEYGY